MAYTPCFFYVKTTLQRRADTQCICPASLFSYKVLKPQSLITADGKRLGGRISRGPPHLAACLGSTLALPIQRGLPPL